LARICGIEEVQAYLLEPKNGVFQWGKNDCCLFANNMLVEVFGFKDLAIDFRGKYTTKIGAARLIRKNGYKSVKDIAEKNAIETKDFGVGYIVYHPTNESLGVCFGDYSYFLKEQQLGLQKILTKDCRKIWRVK